MLKTHPRPTADAYALAGLISITIAYVAVCEAMKVYVFERWAPKA